MNLDLTKEKDRRLTTQQMYEIIDFAVQAAEDNGFINSFIFQRAIYCFAALMLYPDRKDDYAGDIAKNVNEAWDRMLEDGLLDEMLAEYQVELELLEANGALWVEEYRKYAGSARGMFSLIQEFSGDIMRQAMLQLQEVTSDPNLKTVNSIAEAWGMTPKA